MSKIVNYLRGSIRIQTECRYPERFINICAQNGVEFWDLERVNENTVNITMNIGGYRRLRLLQKEGGFAVKPVRKKGAPFLLWRVRKRYTLIGGMVLCLFMAWFLSLFIWEIEVSGNETVPTADIMSALEELDVGIGTFGFSVTPEYISNEVLQKIPKLSWITVNVNGGRADVLVRERVMKPEMVDENEPTLVYAKKAGIITEMIVLAGKSTAAVGDTVLPGDVLVTGVMESKSSDTRFVHAMGDIYARTWYELSAEMPLNMYEKSYSGEEKTKTAVIIAGKRLNLYINSGIPWQCYDKITERKNVSLPDGTRLPITVVKEMYTEYAKRSATFEETAAEEILKKELLAALNEKIGGGEIVTEHFVKHVSNGKITVTLSAECTEQIGEIRPLTNEEMTLPKAVEEET